MSETAASDRRSQQIYRHLHTADGWVFSRFIKFTDMTNCPACGGRMGAGVEITHPEHGTTVVGEGVVKKYLNDVEMPRRTAENTETREVPPSAVKTATPKMTEDGAEKPVRKGRKAKNSDGVEELSPEANDALMNASGGDGLGDVDLDKLAAALQS